MSALCEYRLPGFEPAGMLVLTMCGCIIGASQAKHGKKPSDYDIQGMERMALLLEYGDREHVDLFDRLQGDDVDAWLIVAEEMRRHGISQEKASDFAVMLRKAIEVPDRRLSAQDQILLIQLQRFLLPASSAIQGRNFRPAI